MTTMTKKKNSEITPSNTVETIPSEPVQESNEQKSTEAAFDQATIEAMNSTPEKTEENQSSVIYLPQNEEAYLREIVKTPLENNQFEISKDAPKNAFKGAKSPKTLANTAKNKLIERGIIKSIQKGSAQSRAIVELLVDINNIQMSNQGRGRKVDRIHNNERHLTKEKYHVTTTSRGRYSLDSILNRMKTQYEDFNSFQKDLANIKNKYPNYFTNFLKTIKNEE